MSSQELYVLNRRVVAGTSHGGEISVENETNEVTQEATKKTHISKQILTDFCDNSTVQGVRYLTKPKLHWIERLFWSAAIASSFLFGFIGMSNLWQAWNRNPVIVKYDDKITSISNFPFPAITICPTKKFFKEIVNIDRILKAIKTNDSALDDFTPSELSQMNLIVQSCSNFKFYSISDEMIILSHASVLETFKNITNFKKFQTVIARFHAKVYDNLKPILTPEGLCFTFNSLNSDEIYTDNTEPEIKTVQDNSKALNWNRDDGYRSHGNQQNLFPTRSIGSLSQFVALLRISLDDSHEQCSPIALGFHLSIHAPDELPRVSSDFIHIPPEQYSTIVMKPDVIVTSDGLRSYAPHTRNCFFGSERPLHFFKSYTQNKCELECLTNFTKNECGCVHFSMPRIKYTRVCTMLDKDCYIAARHAFGKNLIAKDCDCLPDCTSFSYNVERTQVQQPFYTKKTEINRMNERSFGLSNTSRTIVVVSLKEPHFIMMMRTETSTMYDFISNCGSLLGMCLGVSILSIVELVYFFTLRLYLLLRGREPTQTTVDSHGTLTSIMKKPFEKLKLRFQSKKPKHEIITVRPICDDNPDQIWNESEMQTEVELTTQKQFCTEMIQDFCNNSTIHGLRYFTELNRHRSERVWWVIAVFLSILICIIAIFSIWTNWQQNPVITAFDDGRTPIETVPFPAVTVCPMKPFILSEKVAKILKASQEGRLAVEDFSDEELCLLNALSQVQFISGAYKLNIKIPSCPSIYETIENLTLDQDSVVNFTSWMGQRDQLSFKPIYTELGRCFTFNSLNSQQIYADDVLTELKTVHGNPNATYWNREDGYQPNIDRDKVYPRRLYGAVIFEGLFARFQTVFDSSDAVFSNVMPGLLQLTIHSPDELPKIRFNILYISSEQDTFVSIRPSVTSTSNGLRSYAPRARGCYYNSERHLRFFKSYSYQKCEWECLTNFTRNECGCVPFTMPSVEGTKMCSMLDRICYTAAKNEFYFKNKFENCDCLPDCTSISYQAEISTAPFHFYEDDQTKNVEKFYHVYGFLARCRLFVSFKEDHFTTVNRTEIMTMSDFISTCGGLFGLFMGISWLSIVELLYYFTLRLSRKWIQPEADTDSDSEDDAVVAIPNEANSESSAETEIQDNSAENNVVETNVNAEVHYDAVASTSKCNEFLV